MSHNGFRTTVSGPRQNPQNSVVYRRQRVSTPPALVTTATTTAAMRCTQLPYTEGNPLTQIVASRRTAVCDAVFTLLLLPSLHCTSVRCLYNTQSISDCNTSPEVTQCCMDRVLHTKGGRDCMFFETSSCYCTHRQKTKEGTGHA